MSQFSAASATSVMDDMFKIKQRMSTGSTRSNPPRLSVDREDYGNKTMDPIPEILSKAVTSPKHRIDISNIFRYNLAMDPFGELFSVYIFTVRSSSKEDDSNDISTEKGHSNYFQHVNFDDEINALQSDLNSKSVNSENTDVEKWSTDAFGGTDPSAFKPSRSSLSGKVSPLTMHSQGSMRNIPGKNMASIQEVDENDSMHSFSKDSNVTKSPNTSPAAHKKKIDSDGDSKESPTSGKKVSGQVKSLQDTLEEVLKSGIDQQMQHDEFVGNAFGKKSRLTNTVSARAQSFSSRKGARKRNPPTPINVESLASITEADSALESLGRNSESSITKDRIIPGKLPIGFYFRCDIFVNGNV